MRDLYFYIRHIVAVNYHTQLWYDGGRPLKRVWFRWGYKIDLCFHANKTRGMEATIILTFSWITFSGATPYINRLSIEFQLIVIWDRVKNRLASRRGIISFVIEKKKFARKSYVRFVRFKCYFMCNRHLCQFRLIVRVIGNIVSIG